MKPMTVFAALAMLAISLPTQADASDKTLVVKFKPGTSYATRKGSVSGYDVTTYILDAYAGQTVSVLFTANRASCTFNFFAPGSSTADHIGDIAGNEYSGTLYRSGKHRVSVGMNRNAARKGLRCTYSVSFEIR